jgi:hypothetical protein
VVLVVLGSVIEVRVRLLPFSVPVPVWFHSLTPDPNPSSDVVMCGATRRAGVLGAAAGRMGSVGWGWVGCCCARSTPVCSPCCEPVSLVLSCVVVRRVAGLRC